MPSFSVELRIQAIKPIPKGGVYTVDCTFGCMIDKMKDADEALRVAILYFTDEILQKDLVIETISNITIKPDYET